MPPVKRPTTGQDDRPAKKAKTHENVKAGPSNPGNKKASKPSNNNKNKPLPAGTSKEEQNFGTSLRRSFQWLKDNNRIGKPPGYIQAKVKAVIKVPATSREKEKFQLGLVPPDYVESKDKGKGLLTKPGGGQGVLDVFLATLHLDNLDPLKVDDIIKLSLKGARIEELEDPKHRFPKRLKYTEGYHFRFNGHEINTFIAPPKAVMAPPAINKPPPVPAQTVPLPQQQSSERKISIPRESPVQTSRPLSPPRSEPRDVKSEEKPPLPHEPEIVHPKAEPTETQIHKPISNHASISSAGPSRLLDHANGEVASTQKRKQNELSEPTILPPAGYAAICSLGDRQGQNLNLIGVVVRCDPPKQTRNDPMRVFRILDATSFGDRRDGYTINFFASTMPSLPDPQVGDIIILRNIKMNKYHGNPQGVGYPATNRWAVFSKETRSVCYPSVGPEGPPPESQVGPADRYTDLKAVETDYCLQLSEWWKGVEGEMDKDRVVSNVVSTVAATRRHKLVSELPQYPTNRDYFDFTVEVLRILNTDNNPATVLVTDYTASAYTFPHEAEWCPKQLTPVIFQIEFWDAAANALRERMKENQVYTLRNTRVKLNKVGYVEGKQVEDKITLMGEKDEEGKMVDSEHYQAFLKRREEFKQKTGYNPETFTDKLIKDAELDCFFHCTVEVLHSEYQEDRFGTLWCTDYTSRNDLGGVPMKPDWSKGLENKIFKVTLTGGQMRIAETLKRGDFCRFKKMRLKSHYKHKYTIGSMGGSEALMEKLNPRNKDNELLQDLLRRKRALEVAKLPGSTFQQILDLKLPPEKFRVFARIVHYEPRRLEEAISLWCNSCNRTLRHTEKMCVECEADTNLEPRSNLVLTAEDKNMDRVLVTVHEQANIFKNLNLLAYLDEPEVQDGFRKRLEPLVGELYPNRQHSTGKPPTVAMELIAFNDDCEGPSFTLLDAFPCPT